MINFRATRWLAAAAGVEISYVPFSREPGGALARAKLRSSRYARGAYAEASTGRHLISALDALVRTRETVPATEESGIVVPGEKLVRRHPHVFGEARGLEEEGVRKFAASYDELLEAVRNALSEDV